jgi:hypothetical protein
MDRARSGFDAFKRAPSNLQRAVREKQGYERPPGLDEDDEEAGLLGRAADTSDSAAAKRA